MPFDILCSDALHASRSAEPDWAAVLGTSTVDGATGLMCPACARLRESDSTEEDTSNKVIITITRGGSLRISVPRSYPGGQEVSRRVKTGRILDALTAAEATALKSKLLTWWRNN